MPRPLPPLPPEPRRAQQTPVHQLVVEPRLQLALIEELDGDLRAANRDLGEAIARARDDWQLWFVRARLKVKMGEVEGANRALERARQLNPRAPFLAR